jgi:Ca2+-binding EF-hand superfamily protein
MRLTIEEAEKLSAEELRERFIKDLKEEYNIPFERLERLEKFLPKLHKNTEVKTLFDVVDCIKKENFTENELILALGTKVSELNNLTNQMNEMRMPSFETIIKSIKKDIESED